MALEISEFMSVASIQGSTVQIADGQPTAVHTAIGSITLDGSTELIRIKGTGSITWPNTETETFNGTEFRGVSGGMVIVSG